MKTSLLVLIALVLALGAFFAVRTTHAELEWVRGRYGENCYPKGQEHGNIKYKIYYRSLEACENSIGE